MIQRHNVHIVLVVLLAGMMTIFTAGCGGGGGGSIGSAGLGPIGGGGSSSGSLQTCASCHSSFPAANQFTPGDAVDAVGGTSDLLQPSATYYDSLANSNTVDLYGASVHAAQGSGPVNCEGCHGSGAQHYGVGPIQYYQPGIAQCQACHGTTSIDAAAQIDPAAFNATGHANTNNTPDQYFFQGGVGTAQATMNSQPEWANAGGTVPVTKNQHIEECSACHNYSTKPEHIAAGDVPNPPTVRCASCHDPHRPAGVDGTRNFVNFDGAGRVEVAPEKNLQLKPQRVNNTPPNAPGTNFTAVSNQFGAKNVNNGTWIRPRLSFDFHVGGVDANTYAAYITIGKNLPTIAASPVYTVGDFLRLSPERLCASCHTKGTYKYGVASGPAGAPTALGSTHQADIYTQYYRSAHGSAYATNGYGGAFKNFSMLSTSRRYGYPYTMGGIVGQKGYSGQVDPVNPTDANGVPQFIGGTSANFVNGVMSANTTRQISTSSAFDGSPLASDLYPAGTNVSAMPVPAWPDPAGPNARRVGNLTLAYCARCHHGLGSIDYQKGTAWNKAAGLGDTASILWGDSAITCITCHEPHKNGTATTKSVRQPTLLAYNTEFTPGAVPPALAATARLNGGVAKMMDLSPVPNATLGNNVICFMCHQGRESGWTVWNKVRRWVKSNATTDQVAADWWYANPNTPIPRLQLSAVGAPTKYEQNWATVNAHDLPAAPLLIGRNGMEYLTDPKGNALTYSDGIPSHVSGDNRGAGGCVGCHMDTTYATNTLGGHSWNVTDPITGAENVQKCQQCHSGLPDFHSQPTPQDWAGNGIGGDTAYNNIGTWADVKTNVARTVGFSAYSGGDPTVGANWFVNYPNHGKNLGGTGLVGRLNEAMWDNGVYYCQTANGAYRAGSFYQGEKPMVGTTTDTSAVVTALTDTSYIKVGSLVYGPGIQATTRVVSIDSATQVTLSLPATASATVTLVFTAEHLQSGTLTTGSAVVTGLASTAGMTVGAAVTGTGIPASTTISSINSATQITLNKNATATGAQNLTFTALTFLKWTPNLQAAYFNIILAINSGGTNTGAFYVHNPYYAAQLMIDGVEHLPAFPGTTSQNFQNTGAGVLGTGAPRTFIRPGREGQLPPNGTAHPGTDYRNQTLQ